MRHLQLDPLILCRHPGLAGLHSPNSVLASFGSLLISRWLLVLWYLLVLSSRSDSYFQGEALGKLTAETLALSLHSSPLCVWMTSFSLASASSPCRFGSMDLYSAFWLLKGHRKPLDAAGSTENEASIHR